MFQTRLRSGNSSGEKLQEGPNTSSITPINKCKIQLPHICMLATMTMLANLHYYDFFLALLACFHDKITNLTFCTFLPLTQSTAGYVSLIGSTLAPITCSETCMPPAAHREHWTRLPRARSSRRVAHPMHRTGPVVRPMHCTTLPCARSQLHCLPL